VAVGRRPHEDEHLAQQTGHSHSRWLVSHLSRNHLVNTVLLRHCSVFHSDITLFVNRCSPDLFKMFKMSSAIGAHILFIFYSDNKNLDYCPIRIKGIQTSVSFRWKEYGLQFHLDSDNKNSDFCPIQTKGIRASIPFRFHSDSDFCNLD
jgi:hypothetical protein